MNPPAETDKAQSLFTPTRRRLWILSIGWAGVGFLTAAVMYGLALSGASDIVIGGDFIAFQTAAKAALSGDAVSLYDRVQFQVMMAEAFPHHEEANLSWQYPPSYLLLAAPFALPPYLLAYGIWSTGTAALFFLTIRKQIGDRLILFAAITGPAAYAAYITGQNGFLSAALLVLAGVYPKTRPLLAGAAAGLLTIKPHLGLLIPIAYLAAGHWRAFGAAALTASALALLSALIFGAEAWPAFFAAAFETSNRVTEQVMPLAKMATPFNAALYLGLPPLIGKDYLRFFRRRFSVSGLACLAAGR